MLEKIRNYLQNTIQNVLTAIIMILNKIINYTIIKMTNQFKIDKIAIITRTGPEFGETAIMMIMNFSNK